MKTKKSDHITSMYCGDTYLDIYSESYSIEDVYDICIENTDISVWEMVHCLNWDEFKKQLGEALYEARKFA